VAKTIRRAWYRALIHRLSAVRPQFRGTSTPTGTSPTPGRHSPTLGHHAGPHPIPLPPVRGCPRAEGVAREANWLRPHPGGDGGLRSRFAVPGLLRESGPAPGVTYFEALRFPGTTSSAVGPIGAIITVFGAPSLIAVLSLLSLVRRLAPARPTVVVASPRDPRSSLARPSVSSRPTFRWASVRASGFRALPPGSRSWAHSCCSSHGRAGTPQTNSRTSDPDLPGRREPPSRNIRQPSRTSGSCASNRIDLCASPE
jgi:hypothetical protein